MTKEGEPAEFALEAALLEAVEFRKLEAGRVMVEATGWLSSLKIIQTTRAAERG